MIKKIKGGYKVVSEKTGRNMGTYKSKNSKVAKAKALRRLRQVEYFKHHKKR